MNNINTLLTLVNKFSPKNQTKKIFYKNKIIFPIAKNGRQDMCKNDIHRFYTAIKKPEKKRIANRRKGAEKYAEFLEQFSYGKLTDSFLKSFGKKWADDNYIITVKYPNEQPISFVGNQKGNERYNKKYNKKIQDICGSFDPKKYDLFAITLTYDIKTYGKDRFKAWKEYPNHIAAWLENLRKHKDCVFARVTESTKKGYPHTHIVFGLPSGTCPEYNGLKDRTEIKYGYLYEHSLKYCKSKIFHLEKISGTNVKFYLSKYISKMTNKGLKEICNKKGRLSDSDRKSILGLLGTVITDTRSLSYTQPKTILKRNQDMPKECKECIERWIKSEEKNEGEQNKVFKKNVPNDVLECLDYDFIWSEKLSSERAKDARRYLIMLCNNSPFSCKRFLTFNKQSQYVFKSNHEFLGHEELKMTDYHKIVSLSKNYGCNGCLFSDLSELITTGHCVNLDFLVEDGDGVVFNLFDDCVVNDDVKFIKALSVLCTYLQQKMFIEGESYENVISDNVLINTEHRI